MSASSNDELLSDLPPDGYRVIEADPPWNYKVRSKKGEARSAEAHYRTMSLEDICALPVAQLAAKDCHLFLWATRACLPHALRVMDAWGFEFSSMAFVWVKLNKRAPTLFMDKRSFFMGMGHTTRANAEYVLLGRKGAPKRLRKDIRELVIAPLREHSRKPDEVYDRIEQYAPGPYCRLFAREERDGWTSWGDQVGMFGSPSAAPAQAAE
jgi:N6-adenosine-specific RNA methylase IME4